MSHAAACFPPAPQPASPPLNPRDPDHLTLRAGALIFGGIIVSLSAIFAIMEYSNRDLRLGLSRLENKFDRFEQHVERRFERMDQRFERIDQRFERMDQRFVAIESKVDVLNRKVDGIQIELTHTNRRLDKVEQQVEGTTRPARAPAR